MKSKILILDDDNDILEILAFLLTETGYEVRTLNCGDTIFGDINEFHPDLIIMDVMLAGMDGRTICKDIKESHLTNSLPIILMSGTHDLAQSLYQIGAPNDFVAKPFDIDQLLEKIAQQLSANTLLNI